MSRSYSYINTAEKIIELYKGNIPFSIFIKQFFSAEKKYGSNDRKQISGLCYNYFRLGHAWRQVNFAAKNISVKEKILIGYFLCNNEPAALLEQMNTSLNDKIQLPIEEKIASLANDFSIDDIFPYKNELSDGVDEVLFSKSFLVQPDLFLRIRPAHKKEVIKKITSSSLNYSLLNDNCIALSSSTKAETIFDIDKEVVIQDYNSQQVLNYFDNKTEAPLSLWDCCAASGGKSILAWDVLKENFELTVSDIRESIIKNLQQRLKKAEIKNYKYFIADIENESLKSKAGNYNVIICDAPCTGSGTWGRTPEQLCFFNPGSINEFNSRQKKIASNAIHHLKKDGLFFYITCSVFKKENEEVVRYLEEQHQLNLLSIQLLKGYDKKADSMFVAVLKK